ncbi:MAG: hypothetical protein K5Q00_01630 [Gammaproteobacteria bacterium]|nr:hypothetical protein [Gammaproteobacteria bacterium]
MFPVPTITPSQQALYDVTIAYLNSASPPAQRFALSRFMPGMASPSATDLATKLIDRVSVASSEDIDWLLQQYDRDCTICHWLISSRKEHQQGLFVQFVDKASAQGLWKALLMPSASRSPALHVALICLPTCELFQALIDKVQPFLAADSQEAEIAWSKVDKEGATLLEAAVCYSSHFSTNDPVQRMRCIRDGDERFTLLVSNMPKDLQPRIVVSVFNALVERNDDQAVNQFMKTRHIIVHYPRLINAVQPDDQKALRILAKYIVMICTNEQRWPSIKSEPKLVVLYPYLAIQYIMQRAVDIRHSSAEDLGVITLNTLHGEAEYSEHQGSFIRELFLKVELNNEGFLGNATLNTFLSNFVSCCMKYSCYGSLWHKIGENPGSEILYLYLLRWFMRRFSNQEQVKDIERAPLCYQLLVQALMTVWRYYYRDLLCPVSRYISQPHYELRRRMLSNDIIREELQDSPGGLLQLLPRDLTEPPPSISLLKLPHDLLQMLKEKLLPLTHIMMLPIDTLLPKMSYLLSAYVTYCEGGEFLFSVPEPSPQQTVPTINIGYVTPPQFRVPSWQRSTEPQEFYQKAKEALQELLIVLNRFRLVGVLPPPIDAPAPRIVVSPSSITTRLPATG